MNNIPAFSLGDLLNYGYLYLAGKTGTAYFIIALILICAAGYLLGGINSAILVSKKMYGKDIRESGSGNAGLTNVLRTYGKKAAIITLVGDIGKTAISCLIGALALGQTGAFLAGLAATLGHMWPVWFGFKGGKGVLSLATVILICSPKVFLICFTVFFVIVAFSKYISLGSVVCALLMPIVLSRFIGMQNLVIIPMIIVCLIIVWKHRTNIKRLREGKENKVHLGKNGGFLPKWLLILISSLLAAGSILAIFLTFRTEFAAEYNGERITSAYMRVMFINEKNAYFGDAEQNDEHDDEIMNAAADKITRMLILRDAASSEGKAITDAGRNAAINYFSDLGSLRGSRENDTAETYCHRIYGNDVSPNDVVRLTAALNFADEYAASVSEEKIKSLLDENAAAVKVSDKICKSIKERY